MERTGDPRLRPPPASPGESPAPGGSGGRPPGPALRAQAKVLVEHRAAFAAAWGYVDLNHGPRPYQGRALTD